MIDYEFYVGTYLGNEIPESAFPGAMVRATQALQKIRRQYRVKCSEAISESMALCAMAEAIYSYHSHKSRISSAAVGNVSVRYEKESSLSCQLLQKAKIYLDIYRGVSPCSAP